MPKAFGGTRKAAPATDTRFGYGHRSARQMRQPTASAAKTKQRYKKRSNCKHKKSGCVCFIVAQLRASALRNRDIRDNKALCAPTDPTAKLRIYARTARSIAQKEEHFSASNYPPDKTRGKETRLPDHHNKPGSFSHLLPHSARRRVTQFVRTPLRFALTPARVYAHSAVFRLLSSPFTSHPYSTQNVTIRGEDFAFIRSSPSSPEKRNLSHRLFSC